MALELPPIGLGVYKAGDAVYRAVRYALEIGYRHVDCAKIYGNEALVGQAIRESGIPREEIYVTTKLWPEDYPRAKGDAQDRLRCLGLEYVDAMLLHWPGVDAALRYRAYEALLQMQQQGQARQVGVSNFLIDQLEDLAAQGLPKPVCNQLEAHPWYPQREVRAYCHRQGIQAVCWAPLFRGAWKEAPVLAQIAQAHGKTPAQAVLRWHVQNGDCPIPKSVTPSRIAENLDIFDFALTPEEMAAIDALEDGRHISHDPHTYDGAR